MLERSLLKVLQPDRTLSTGKRKIKDVTTKFKGALNKFDYILKIS